MRETLRRLRLIIRLSYEAAPRPTVLEFALGPIELLGSVIAAVLLKLTADAVLDGDGRRAMWTAIVLGVSLAMSGVVAAMHVRASANAKPARSHAVHHEPDSHTAVRARGGHDTHILP